MKSIVRILMNLMLPIPAGRFLSLSWAIARGAGKVRGTEGPGMVAAMGILFCAIYGLVPTIIYAAFAEFLYRRGMSPNSRKAIIVATSYGGAAAMSIFAFFLLLLWFGGQRRPFLKSQQRE